MILILRNIAFYAIFYLFSPVYIILSVLVMYFSVPMLRRSVRGWCNFHRFCMAVFLGITVREEGEKPQGAYFYAIKHESFFEAIDVPANLDWPAPFAKQELFMIPGWGWAAKVYGCVPVARADGASALRAMVATGRALASKNRPLVIFPEGTRVVHGTGPQERAPLRSGFAGLYKLIGLPVVPVAVDSGPLYHRRLKRPGVITYRYGAVIEPGLKREVVETRVLDAINSLNDDPARKS